MQSVARHAIWRPSAAAAELFPPRDSSARQMSLDVDARIVLTSFVTDVVAGRRSIAYTGRPPQQRVDRT